MIYLIDTDTLIFYLRGRTEVVERILGEDIDDLCTSSVCLGELYYGAVKSSQRERRTAEVDELKQYLPLISFGAAETQRFGKLKANLELRGEKLSDADLMIAATALEHNLTLVTGNSKHFNRIKRLTIDNWIKR